MMKHISYYNLSAGDRVIHVTTLFSIKTEQLINYLEPNVIQSLHYKLTKNKTNISDIIADTSKDKL